MKDSELASNLKLDTIKYENLLEKVNELEESKQSIIRFKQTLSKVDLGAENEKIDSQLEKLTRQIVSAQTELFYRTLHIERTKILFNTLPVEYSKIFKMICFECKSVKQIAKETGYSIQRIYQIQGAIMQYIKKNSF